MHPCPAVYVHSPRNTGEHIMPIIKDVSFLENGAASWSTLKPTLPVAYVYPNDEMENQRLEFQNRILYDVLGGKHFFAPWTASNPPRRVLDVGTGTGEWAIDIADQFPLASVFGIDLSPIQNNMVPPNVRFYVQDA